MAPELMTVSPSGTAFCLREQLDPSPVLTFGSASRLTRRTTREDLIASASSSCGSAPWTSASLQPYPIGSLCVGQGDDPIVICRAVQRLLRRTIASPR